MNVQRTKNKNGFTIIEVVLVLAIAALIFLMVFIALPALQRNQRDAARKSQSAKVLSAITSYQGNNKGSNPALGDSFAKYLDGTYSSTDDTITLEGGEFTVTIENKPSNLSSQVSNVTTDNIVVVYQAKCGATEGTVADGTRRQAAILVQLENADAIYCQSA